MRTLVDIPDEDVRWLDRLAADESKSRTALVREAVTGLRATRTRDMIARGAGHWRNRDDIGDAVEYQRAIRADRDPV